MATPTPVTLDELNAAKGRAQAMAESLGLSPGSTKIMVASALGTFAGSAMAAKAPAAAAVTSTRVGKLPVRPEPQAMAGASSSASEPPSLKGRPRGSQVLVQVAAEYGARKVYTFSDVCALATRIMAGTLMVADLQQKNSDGAWTYGIPRSTMLDKWLKDDHSFMQSQNHGSFHARRAERAPRRPCAMCDRTRWFRRIGTIPFAGSISRVISRRSQRR
jgi:hypothetical protein